MRLADDGEIQFRGPTLFKGYWRDPVATAEAYTPDGWYRTGDIGHLDGGGRLILSGRSRDMIVLPNGFNVYPEDIENALRVAGLRDSVAVETRPGRIEAIVLRERGSEKEPAGVDEMVKSANGHLGPNQRIAGWRVWPDEDFPRTHTLKIKRAPVRAWAIADAAAAAAAPADVAPEVSRPPPPRPPPLRTTPSPIPRRVSRRSGTQPPAIRAPAGSPAPRDPGPRREPAVQDDGHPELAQDLDRSLWRLDATGTRREVVLLLGGGNGCAVRVRELVDHDVSLGRILRQDHLVDGPRRAGQERRFGRPDRGLRIGQHELVIGEQPDQLRSCLVDGRTHRDRGSDRFERKGSPGSSMVAQPAATSGRQRATPASQARDRPAPAPLLTLAAS